ncbi:hypothetical protein WN51_12994 [Melipona quadrifasciata]|uniref:Uncharacterized protein n=1 Tax=Melipona quadrifasciata TaxID=166423 RepID=A0A0N0BKF7_9HYME|nr:hypothetical protein WN51_12994 [Melipona quadrifasciata]
MKRKKEEEEEEEEGLPEESGRLKQNSTGQVTELITQSNTHQRHNADMHLLLFVQSHFVHNALAIVTSRLTVESNVASEKENRRLKVGKSTGAKEKGKLSATLGAHRSHDPPEDCEERKWFGRQLYRNAARNVPKVESLFLLVISRSAPFSQCNKTTTSNLVPKANSRALSVGHVLILKPGGERGQKDETRRNRREPKTLVKAETETGESPVWVAKVAGNWGKLNCTLSRHPSPVPCEPNAQGVKKILQKNYACLLLSTTKKFLWKKIDLKAARSETRLVEPDARAFIRRFISIATETTGGVAGGPALPLGNNAATTACGWKRSFRRGGGKTKEGNTREGTAFSSATDEEDADNETTTGGSCQLLDKRDARRISFCCFSGSCSRDGEYAPRRRVPPTPTFLRVAIELQSNTDSVDEAISNFTGNVTPNYDFELQASLSNINMKADFLGTDFHLSRIQRRNEINQRHNGTIDKTAVCVWQLPKSGQSRRKVSSREILLHFRNACRIPPTLVKIFSPDSYESFAVLASALLQPDDTVELPLTRDRRNKTSRRKE